MVELTKNYPRYQLKNEISLELTTCDIFLNFSLVHLSLIGLYIMRLVLLTETRKIVKS